MTEPPPLKFEAALRRLESIVRRLESGEAELEESIKIYEEGMKLKALCESKLQAARLKVDQITLSAEGEVKTKPFDGDKDGDK